MLEDFIANWKAFQPFPLRIMDGSSRIACVPAQLGDSPQFLPAEQGDQATRCLASKASGAWRRFCNQFWCITSTCTVADD